MLVLRGNWLRDGFEGSGEDVGGLEEGFGEFGDGELRGFVALLGYSSGLCLRLGTGVEDVFL